MASFTVKRPDVFPAGTSVGVYPESTAKPGAAPSGSSVATATAAANGVAFSSGLAEDAAYVAYAKVGAEHRYIRFRVSASPAARVFSSASAIADRLRLEGDTEDRYQLLADGTVKKGPGSSPPSVDSGYGGLAARTAALEAAGALSQRQSRYTRAMNGAAVMSSPPTITQGTVTSFTANTYVTTAANDPRIRWSGAPMFGYAGDATGAIAGRAPSTSSGLSSSRFVGPLRCAFDHYGQAFEVIISASAGTKFRLWVNEQPHATAPAALPASTGNNAWLKFDFGSTALRRIVIEFDCGDNSWAFKGLVHLKVDGLFPPTVQSPRVAWLGDSYANGVGANYASQAYSVQTARLLGWLDVFTQPAVAGTGFVRTGQPSVYQDRLADIVGIAPDVVVIQGTINDKAENQTSVRTAAELVVTSIRAALPAAKLVMTGPLYVATPDAAQITTRDTLQTAAANQGVPFMDAFPTPLWFSGTGKVGGTTGDGSADVMRASDGVHPSGVGHDALRDRVGAGLASLLSLGL